MNSWRSTSTSRPPLWAMARILERRFLFIALLIFCLVSAVRFAIVPYFGISLLGQAGYGDLYVFDSVTYLQRTGVIYPDPTQELPRTYGPLLYLLLGIPARFMNSGNPLSALRPISAGAFILSLALAASITHALAPHRRLWLWSPALALTFTEMPFWVLQLRGDFMAIALGLLAVRLLFFRNVAAAAAAGVCAGLATQFKFTYLAAFAAGLLWLAVNRRWKHLAAFGFAGALMSAGLYALFLTREPRLLDNILSLSPPIVDFKGAVRLAAKSLGAPAMLLALSVIPFLRWHLKSRWMLLALFAGISFAIGGITDLHAGGSANYFFEAQIAATPLAALAVLKLHRPAFSVAGIYLAGILLLGFTPPVASDLLNDLQRGPSRVSDRNQEVTVLRDAFRGRSVLALATDAAFSAPEIVVSDPWLASYLERRARYDLRPLAEQIRHGKFDVVVVWAERHSYRGIDHLSPTLRQAINNSYQPYCAPKAWVVLSRRNAAIPEALGRRLAEIGCDATACASRSACRVW